MGSGGGLHNIPTDKFNAKVDAEFVNHTYGLHNVRGSLRVKPGDCITVDEGGVSIKVDNACGLSLKSGKLTIDPLLLLLLFILLILNKSVAEEED
mgnify:CR=1 FL=1